MGDDTKTRSASLLAVRRFLSLVEVAGGNTDWISVLCAIYKQDLAPAMFALPLLNHVYGWSQTMCTALDHFCTCYHHKAAVQDWAKEAGWINSLKTIILEPNKKHAYVKKKEAGYLKKDRDADVLEAFAPADKRAEAVFHAMVALYWLVDEAKAADRTTDVTRAGATACIILVIYLDTFAGRSGEWIKMVSLRFARARPKRRSGRRTSRGHHQLISPKSLSK